MTSNSKSARIQKRRDSKAVSKSLKLKRHTRLKNRDDNCDEAKFDPSRCYPKSEDITRGGSLKMQPSLQILKSVTMLYPLEKRAVISTLVAVSFTDLLQLYGRSIYGTTSFCRTPQGTITHVIEVHRLATVKRFVPAYKKHCVALPTANGGGGGPNRFKTLTCISARGNS